MMSSPGIGVGVGVTVGVGAGVGVRVGRGTGVGVKKTEGLRTRTSSGLSRLEACANLCWASPSWLLTASMFAAKRSAYACACCLACLACSTSELWRYKLVSYAACSAQYTYVRLA